MKRLTALALAALCVTASIAPAEAYGHHRHYRFRAYGFRTGYCKRPSCFRKHPGGRYVYPLTHRHHRL